MLLRSLNVTTCHRLKWLSQVATWFFSLIKPIGKLHLVRSLLYRRIFEFCFLLLSQNSFLYYIITPIPASACKNYRKSQTATRRAQSAHPRTTHRPLQPSQENSKRGARNAVFTIDSPGSKATKPRNSKFCRAHRAAFGDIFVLIVAADFAFL